MPKKIKPPSKVDFLTFPVFGLTWSGSPSTPKNDGYSIVAYCGGGGSSKTGVFNKICVLVNVDNHSTTDNASSEGEGGSTTTFTSKQIEISTGEALCFGVYTFRPYNDTLNMGRLVACIGDEVLLYGIPLGKNSAGETNGDMEGEKEEAILLGKVNVGKGYGANVSTYSAIHQDGKLIDCLAVGCENGTVVIFHIQQIGPLSYEFIKATECQGHTKAICAVNFHPRGTQLLSSAKDGTARIFSTSTGTELGVLKCEVHDPNGPPPAQPTPGTMKTKDPRMMKRPPQILVRGCAYGDLEGKVMYTIASGKRGPAYLTKWRTLVPLNKSPGGAPPQQQQNNDEPLSVNQDYRVQCSPVPISAVSLSSDGTMFTMGSVEGSVLLYNIEKQCVVKEFKEVHDLPVTCVASRPVPNVLMLPGDLEGGVNFDAVSASADNRLGQWTLQKKSRVKTPSSAKSIRQKSKLEVWLWEMLRIPLLLIFLLLIVAIRDTIDICSEEFSLSALVVPSGISKAGHCLYREVLWAEESKVSFIPE